MNAADFAALQQVAGPVSRETFEQLEAFRPFFFRWNGRINLVAGSTEEEFWRRHILDSAQLAPLAPEAVRWADMGSGGGFPGLVMAFLLAERAGFVDLIESNRKKTGFLQAAIGTFGLPARVVPRRIDTSYELVSTPEIVTARALAPLVTLLDLAAPWLEGGARALFHKGRDYRREIEESAHRWRFDLVEHRSPIDAESVVLDIRNLRRA